MPTGFVHTLPLCWGQAVPWEKRSMLQPDEPAELEHIIGTEKPVMKLTS